MTTRMPASFLDNNILLHLASETECEILRSQDLQDGALLEGALRVANPFAVR